MKAILKICIGSACHIKGSYDIIKIVSDIIKMEELEEKIELKGSFCLNNCTEGVTGILEINGVNKEVYSFSRDNIEGEFRKIVKENIV